MSRQLVEVFHILHGTQSAKDENGQLSVIHLNFSSYD